MSSALFALGQWCVRRRRLVLTLWLVGLVALGGLAGALHRTTADVFTIPGTEAQRAMDSLSARFPEFAGASAQVVVSAPAGASVTDPAVRTEIESLTATYAALPHVRTAASPFDEHVSGAVAKDGSAAIISLQLDVESSKITEAQRATIVDAATASTKAGLPAAVGGSIFMPTAPKVGLTEGIGVLVAVVVLVLTFGSALAAGIPLLTSLAGVASALLLIVASTRFVEVTSTAPFLALMIGLAVGIDYALFILSRHRDLLAEGLTPEQAAAQATGTAGSAVVFAGATVSIALLALGLADIPFLTQMGIAGALAVVGAVLVALTMLPALLGWAGARLTPKRVAAAHHASRESGFAARWVRAVTRVPILTAALVIGALAVAALPARDLALSLPGNDTAAVGTTQRTAYETISRDFGPGATAPLIVTLDIVSTTDPLGVVAEVKRLVEATPGIVRTTVATPNRSADTGVIIAIPAGAANDHATKDAVAAVRALAPQVKERFGVDLAVTGYTAAQLDVVDRLAGALLPFGIVVVGLSLVLLTLVFRSLLVPVTAALGYLLSLGAAFGAVVAVTQWGWLAGPLGVEQTGPVIAFMPIIIMGVLFGLAMDYHVFLVSSMRARWVHEGGARTAVRTGFVDAGRVVTAAGIIMVSVFAAFVPHGALYIKPIALGLAVGVFVDAFLVRMTLVPALMHMLGERAWWLPRWLDRALPVLDIEGESLARRLHSERARAGTEPLAIAAHGLALHERAAAPAGGAAGESVVFEGVDLAVEPGSVLVVHGAPGSGKTSLLLTLAGRMSGVHGHAEIDGRLLPDQAGAVRRIAALAEIPGVNDLDPLLTVDDHLGERLAATSWHPWVSGASRARARGLVTEVLGYAVAAAPSAHARATLDPQTRVRDLAPLEHWALGVALALVERPHLLVVDDIDALRGTDDQAAAWGVIRALVAAGGTPAGFGSPEAPARPLTVVASCRDLAEAQVALTGIPLVAVQLAAPPTEPEPQTNTSDLEEVLA